MIEALDAIALREWIVKAHSQGVFRTPIEALRTATWRSAITIEGRSEALNSVTMVFNPEHYRRKRPASTGPAPGTVPSTAVPQAAVLRDFDPSRFNF